MKANNDYSEINEKIMMGFRKAIEELIIKTAKEDGELAFSENGKIKIVKAKDLLKNNK